MSSNDRLESSGLKEFITFSLQLDGYVCGDYGVVVNLFRSGSSNVTLSGSVCTVGQVVSYEVGVGDRVEVEYWKTSVTGDHHLHCYSWCTQDGTPPPPTQNEISPGSVAQNFSEPTHHHMEAISVGSNSLDVVYVSPAKVYKLTYNTEDLEGN